MRRETRTMAGHCTALRQTGYTAYGARERLNCFHNKAQECGYTPGALIHGSIIVNVLFVNCKMGLAIHNYYVQQHEPCLASSL